MTSSWRTPPSLTPSGRIIPVEPASAYDLEIALVEGERLRAILVAAKIESAKNRKGGLMERFDKSAVEGGSLGCSTNAAAGRALGIPSSSFKRLCELYEIESPVERKRREKVEVIDE